MSAKSSLVKSDCVVKTTTCAGRTGIRRRPAVLTSARRAACTRTLIMTAASCATRRIGPGALRRRSPRRLEAARPPADTILGRQKPSSERAALLEEDPKAQDKRLLFTEQGRKCVYCGNEYRYDELEIEHMIPKSLGGPDNIRNCQLACSTCNKAKGMMTDIEFRKSHAEYLPQKERTPADPPIDPELFSAPKQKRRRFFRTQR